ncbi:660_t:CDS:2, partial [Gigaspora rosea]
NDVAYEKSPIRKNSQFSINNSNITLHTPNYYPLVTINQYVPLNISTLGDDPTVYNLPVSSAFGIFTGPIQDPAITENGQGIFRLKRDVYNGVTGNQSPLSILCKYPLHNRFNNIVDATTHRPIFSVVGEIVPLTKSSFVLCETIEWNYPTSSHNPQTSSMPNPQSNCNKHQRLKDLERKKPAIFDNNINIDGDFASSSNTICPPFNNPTTSYNMSDPSNYLPFHGILDNNEINNIDSPNIFAPYTQQNELNIHLPKNRLALDLLQQPIPTYANQSTFSLWTLSDNLLSLYHQFEPKILYNHHHILCCYCSILMFQSATHWINIEPDAQYTLPLAFPNIITKIILKLPSVQVAKRKTPDIFLRLSHLSPSKFNQYQCFTVNTCLLYAFSVHWAELLDQIRSIGAFLDPNHQSDWFYHTLNDVSTWLKENNPLFSLYKYLHITTNPNPVPPYFQRLHNILPLHKLHLTYLN